MSTPVKEPIQRGLRDESKGGREYGETSGDWLQLSVVSGGCETDLDCDATGWKLFLPTVS